MRKFLPSSLPINLKWSFISAQKLSRRLFLAGLLIMLGSGFIGNAQEKPGDLKKTQVSSIVGKLVRTTPRLAEIDGTTMYGEPLKITRDMTGIIGHDMEEAEEEVEEGIRESSNVRVTEGVQKTGEIYPNIPISTLGVSISGQSWSGFDPSDNNLAAGPNHVIQIINDNAGSKFQIWNKAGTVVQAPITLAALTGFSGAGDPIVLYDQLADRWFLSEFGPSSCCNQLIIAVSVTADPTGAWKIYQYIDNSFFPDYPKYSVWHNAYYATTNDFNAAGTAYLGSSIYAFDRAAMLAGAATATEIRFRQTGSGNPFYNMGTVCLEGTVPSTQNGLFVYPANSTNLGIFELTPDFVTPANSVVGPLTLMPVTAFAQPPGSITQQGSGITIGTLGSRMLFRMNFRNRGGQETIVATHTVGPGGGGGQASVRWYEIRRSGGTSGPWSVFQQGTLANPDGNSRWMGGISMDDNGTIGLMYDVAGPTSFPSIKFTGRNLTDPLNTMTLAEQTVINGTVSHTIADRWGDYNTLVSDPSTPGDFWGTSQYNNNSTRVFKFSLSIGAPVPVITASTATITAESCTPNNGVIDPAETVTVSFCLQNVGTLNTANLVGTLLPTGGVTAPSAPQSYGVVTAGGGPVCKSFTFTATGTCGGNLIASIQLMDGVTSFGTLTYNFTLGTLTTTFTQNFDAVVAPALPAGWVATNTVGAAPLWVTATGTAVSAPNSIFVANPAAVSDKIIETPTIAVAAAMTQLTFSNNFIFESGFDGGVLEISINGGAYVDIITAGGSWVVGGYTGTISSSFGNPLGGRSGWTGTSAGYITTTVNLPAAAVGQNVKFRFRMGSDSSVSATGWNIDNVSVSAPTCCVPPTNPTVTINQAVAQVDPTNTSPINFTVVFSQPVINFTTGDVTLSGTAGGPLVGTVTGGPTTYNVAVTGMSSTGTVIATIAGGVCTNATLDDNLASTSTDNTVNYTTAPLNDFCADAFPIACGSSTAGTTVNATIDVGTPTCGSATVTSPGVWYKFIGNGGITTLSLCGGATFDTKLGVYGGTCGALVCVGGNDDFCGLQSEVTIPTTSGTTYYVLVHSFGGATGAFTLTLTCTCPTLSVNPVANQTVCNNGATTAVTFTGLEPATVYTWTNDNASIGIPVSGTGNIASFTATNTGSVPVTATITVTPTYTGCPNGPTTSFTITVNPSGQVDVIPNQVLCVGQPTAAVNFTTTVPGTTFSWTNNTTGTGLAASGTGNIASFVTTNATAAPLVSTVTVTPNYGGAGSSPVTFSNTANIDLPAGQPATTSGPAGPYPSPIVVSGLPTTGVAVQSVVLTNITHSWSADIDVLLVSPTGQQFMPMSRVGSSTGFDAAATVTLKDGSPAMPTTSTAIPTGTYAPTAGTPATTTMPAGAPAGPYNLAAPAGTSTFANVFNSTTNYNGTWNLYIADHSAGDYGVMTGGWDITFLVPSASTCAGTPRTFTITVNPTPNVTATPSSQTACSGAAITPIALTSTTAGTTYAWTRDNAAAVTGIPGNGTGNISGTLTNITLAPVTVTFTITPSANGCPGAPITATVTVNPTPQVDQPANQTVCNGTMTAPVNFTSTVPGTTFAWSNNTPSIGLAASGTGNIAAFTATNATTLPVTATVTVTPQYGTPGPVVLTGSLTAPDPTLASRINRNTIASSCAVPKTWPGNFGAGPYFYDMHSLTNNTGASQCVTVSYVSSTVNQVHVSAYNGSFNPANQATNYIADGGSSALSGTPVNFTFTAPAGATIVLVAFNPNVGSTPDYTITVTGLPQSCAGPSKTFDITVNPTPTITCPANMTVASDVGVCNKTVNYTPTVTGTPAPTLSYVLTGATTGSGSGSGSGLKFNVGVTTVTITATNICATVTCSFTITVTDSQLPTVTTQPANRTVCAGSNATFTVVAVTAPSAGGPIAYQWQLWNGSTWNNIAGATAATLTLNSVTQTMNTNSYRVQLTGLCSTVFSNFATLYVNPLPTINLTTSIPPALLPTQVLTITATTAPGGGSYVWFKNGVVIPGATGNTLAGLTVSDIGTYRVVYTDGNGCVATSANVDITGQPSDNLYVYPVPNQGVFNVRFYNQANEQVTVRVFDAKGAEVYSRKVLTTIPYTTINVDLSTNQPLANGTYVVDVRGADGRLMGSRKIIVYNR